MILVLLGTQPQPFARLINELLALEEEQAFGDTEIVVQAGNTRVDDPRLIVFDFVAEAQLQELIAEADLVITHGGAGSIFSALRQDKKVIALPRKAELGEHVDDHQAELVDMLFKEQYLIAEPTLAESMARFKTFKFKKYKSSQMAIIQQLIAWM